ncbi:hypothetical protein E4U55_002332 [Claviceps digitariae]|nr:hypothetical protein E4U55_002332 [Claviceps digitariae]
MSRVYPEVLNGETAMLPWKLILILILVYISSGLVDDIFQTQCLAPFARLGNVNLTAEKQKHLGLTGLHSPPNIVQS